MTKRVRRTRRLGGRVRSAAALSALVVASSGLLSACECDAGPRRNLAEVPSIPYPACAEEPGDVVTSSVLRSGRDMRDQDVVERFEIRRTSECTVVRVAQEWSLGTADVDAVFDADLHPLFIWKRTTMPDASGQVGHLDLRVFDPTSQPVRIARRTPTGAREGTSLAGERPRAVIGPGRGMLTVWLQRADLEVGGRLRESVLDVREPIAVIRDVTLQRHEDRAVEGLGTVRVYTIYGREPLFADRDNVVVGDMMGMRRADAVPGPIPDPLPDPGPVDPHEAP